MVVTFGFILKSYSKGRKPFLNSTPLSKKKREILAEVGIHTG
jgi:hypothetical protein